MPDKSKNIERSLDNLDNQIVDIVGEFVKRRREHYVEAAQKLHENLKKDTKRYAQMLADEKIKQEDFEFLVKGRWAQLKIELLSEASISQRKFEGIAGQVLNLTLDTVIAAI